MKTAMSQLRWFINGDLPEMLKIEHQGFQFPWSEENFVNALSRKDVVCLVCDYPMPDGEIVVAGYMVYSMKPNSFDIYNMAIHADFRRKGIGAKFIGKLKSKLSPRRRSKITAIVAETNLKACKFFKSQKFVAIETMRGYFDETDWDAYKFEYALVERKKMEMKNRMGVIIE